MNGVTNPCLLETLMSVSNLEPTAEVQRTMHVAIFPSWKFNCPIKVRLGIYFLCIAQFELNGP